MIKVSIRERHTRIRAAAVAAEKRTGKARADMSLEELMNESVTSVSKKETMLNASPAAIAMVSAEDYPNDYA